MNWKKMIVIGALACGAAGLVAGCGGGFQRYGTEFRIHRLYLEWVHHDAGTAESSCFYETVYG